MEAPGKTWKNMENMTARSANPVVEAALNPPPLRQSADSRFQAALVSHLKPDEYSDENGVDLDQK